MAVMIRSVTTGLQVCSFICSHLGTYRFRGKDKRKYFKELEMLVIILNMKNLKKFLKRPKI